MPKVQLKKISKTFENGCVALNDFNLEILDQEFMTVVGPSGCGKTTLLRILAGLDNPCKGSIYFGDDKINQVAPKDRDIGMVFQNYALFPHLSVFDNMAFSLKAQKCSPKDIHNLITSVAKRLDIDNLLNRKPHQISGGQKQRVALGRLLAKDPQIRLFDEPLSNLDAHLRNSMRRELKKIHADSPKTTLFVTHDQEEAMTLGQRVCVIKSGSIEQIGTPTEIYHSPSNQFVAEFFGAPPINLLDGEVCRYQDRPPRFKTGSFSLEIPNVFSTIGNQMVRLGIRAENFEVLAAPPNNEPEALTGTIYEVDDLGKEKILHIDIGHSNLSLKIETDRKLSGEKITLLPKWNNVSWFDPKSGLRI